MISTFLQYLLVALLGLSQQTETSKYFAGTLARCENFDAKHYTHLQLCAESWPDHKNKKKRRFLLAIRDSRKLSKDKRHHALVSSTRVAVETDEYLDYKNFGFFELDKTSLVWVSVVRGLPNDYTEGYTLVFQLDLRRKRFKRLPVRFVCQHKCSNQFVSYQSGGGKTSLFYEATANGQQLRSRYAWDGKRLIADQIQEPKNKDALERGNTRPAFVPICKRTIQIQTEIIRRLQTKKPCSKIDEDDLKKITFLELRHKGISQLKPGDFSGFENLSSIDLAHNPIARIRKRLFDGLFKLTSLNLQGCSLQTIPSGVFSHLGSLKDLYLNHNQISKLPAGTFEGLDALTFLSLNDNRLSKLPEGIFAPCKKLKHAYLNNNPLSHP